MATLKGPGEAMEYDGSHLRIGILHARWNSKIVDTLVDGAKKALVSSGVKTENIEIQSVPGSYELPFAAQRMYSASQTQSSTAGNALVSAATDLLASTSTSDLTTTAAPTASKSSSALSQPFDALITIGVLIKGETMHFEYIADAVSHGLMRVQLDSGVPLVFGLLTVLNEEQGMARAGIGEKGGHNHGEDWGKAAVELGVKRNGWAEGKMVA
ncbi:MAG: hypothetical protein Q9157_001078 [Trypethelium eluteriae]